MHHCERHAFSVHLNIQQLFRHFLIVNLTYHSDNCGTLIEGLKFKIRGMAVPVTLAEDMTPYTADMLHRKFGFCYIGMTAFATDYGLDMEKAYTFAQMRQIVREKGHKPSLRNYKRELKQINIIQ